MDDSQFVVSECSLPPMVEGPVEGEVEVCVPLLLMVTSSSPATNIRKRSIGCHQPIQRLPLYITRLLWWGETGTGTIFLPKLVTSSKQMEVYEKKFEDNKKFPRTKELNATIFPIRSKLESIKSYFTDMGKLTVEVQDSRRSVVGRCIVPMDKVIMTGDDHHTASISGRYPILSCGGYGKTKKKRLGELYFCLRLRMGGKMRHHSYLLHGGATEVEVKDRNDIAIKQRPIEEEGKKEYLDNNIAIAVDSLKEGDNTRTIPDLSEQLQKSLIGRALLDEEKGNENRRQECRLKEDNNELTQQQQPQQQQQQQQQLRIEQVEDHNQLRLNRMNGEEGNMCVEQSIEVSGNDVSTASGALHPLQHCMDSPHASHRSESHPQFHRSYQPSSHEVSGSSTPPQMEINVLPAVAWNDNSATSSVEVHYDTELLAQLLERGERLRMQMISAAESTLCGGNMLKPSVSMKLNDEGGGLGGSYIPCNSSNGDLPLPPFSSLPTDCLYSSVPSERCNDGVLHAILDLASPPPASLAFPSVAMGDIARVEALASVRFLRIRLNRLVMFGSATSNAHGCGWQLRFCLPREAEPFNGSMTVSFPVVPNNIMVGCGGGNKSRSSHSRHSYHSSSNKSEKTVVHRKGHGAVHLSLGETIISSETVCAIYMSDAVASRWIPTEGSSSSSSSLPSQGCGIYILLVDGQSETPPPPESDSMPLPLVTDEDRVVGLAHVPLCNVLMSPSLAAVLTVDLKEVVHGCFGVPSDSSSRQKPCDLGPQQLMGGKKSMNYRSEGSNKKISGNSSSKRLVVGKRSIGTISVAIELLPAPQKVSGEDMKRTSGGPAPYSTSGNLGLIGKQQTVLPAKRRNEKKGVEERKHHLEALNDNAATVHVPDLPPLEGKPSEKNQRRVTVADGPSAHSSSSRLVVEEEVVVPVSRLVVEEEVVVPVSAKRTEKNDGEKCKSFGSPVLSEAIDNTASAATRQLEREENQSENQIQSVPVTHGNRSSSCSEILHQTDYSKEITTTKPVSCNMSVKIFSAVELEPVKLLSGMARTTIPPSVLEILSHEGTQGVTSIRVAYVLGWGEYPIQEVGSYGEPHMETHGTKDDENQCWLFSHHTCFPLQLRKDRDKLLGWSERVLIFEVWIKCGNGDDILLGLAKASLDIWSSVEVGIIESPSETTIFPVINDPLDIVNPFSEERMGSLNVCLTLNGVGLLDEKGDKTKNGTETIITSLDDPKLDRVHEEFESNVRIVECGTTKQSSSVTINGEQEVEERKHHPNNMPHVQRVSVDPQENPQEMGKKRKTEKRKDDTTIPIADVEGHSEMKNTVETDYMTTAGHVDISLLKNKGDDNMIAAFSAVDVASNVQESQRQEDGDSKLMNRCQNGIDNTKTAKGHDVATTQTSHNPPSLEVVVRNNEPKGVVVGEVVSCSTAESAEPEGFLGIVKHVVEFSMEGIAPLLGGTTALQVVEGEEELTRVHGCVISYNLLGRNHELWWDRYSAVLNTKQRHRIRVHEGKENVLSVLFSSESPKELVMELYAEPEDHSSSREHMGSVSLPVCDLQPLLLGNSSSIHLSLPVIPPQTPVDLMLGEETNTLSSCHSISNHCVSILPLFVERRQEPQALARRRIAEAGLSGDVCLQLPQCQSSPETQHVVLLRLTAVKKCCITLHISPVACPESDSFYSSPIVAAEQTWEFRVPIDFSHAATEMSDTMSLVVKLNVDILGEENNGASIKRTLRIPVNDLLFAPGIVRFSEPGLPLFEAFIEHNMIEDDKDERHANDDDDDQEMTVGVVDGVMKKEEDRFHHLTVHPPTMTWQQQQQLGANPVSKKNSSAIGHQQQPVVELFLERVLNLPPAEYSSSTSVYASYSWRRLNDEDNSEEESACDPSPAVNVTEGGPIVFNCLRRLSNPLVMLPLEYGSDDEALWDDNYALVVRVWRRFGVLPPPVSTDDGYKLRDDVPVGSVMVDLKPLRHVPIDGWYHLYDDAHWQVGQIKFRIFQRGGGASSTSTSTGGGASYINAQNYSEIIHKVAANQLPLMRHLNTESCIIDCPRPAVFEEDVTVAGAKMKSEEFTLSFADVRRDMERVKQRLIMLSSEEKSGDHHLSSFDLPLETASAVPATCSSGDTVNEAIVVEGSPSVVVVPSIRNREIVHAAQIIQSAWRKARLREEVQRSNACVTIQAALRGLVARRQVNIFHEQKCLDDEETEKMLWNKKRNNAARVLQTNLRSLVHSAHNRHHIQKPNKTASKDSPPSSLPQATATEEGISVSSLQKVTEPQLLNMKEDDEYQHATSTAGMGLEEEDEGQWQMSGLSEVAEKAKERMRLAPFSATNNRFSEEGRKSTELPRLLRPHQFSDAETARIARIMQGSLSKVAEESD